MEIIIVEPNTSEHYREGIHDITVNCYDVSDTIKIATEMLSDYLTTRGHDDDTVDFIINDIERYLQFQFAE